MVKECRVILNNEECTVVRFDNIDIQIPAIRKDAESVFVKNENGRYIIVENDEKESEVEKPKNDVEVERPKKKAPRNKPTVVKESVEESEDVPTIM